MEKSNVDLGSLFQGMLEREIAFQVDRRIAVFRRQLTSNEDRIKELEAWNTRLRAGQAKLVKELRQLGEMVLEIATDPTLDTPMHALHERLVRAAGLAGAAPAEPAAEPPMAASPVAEPTAEPADEPPPAAPPAEQGNGEYGPYQYVVMRRRKKSGRGNFFRNIPNLQKFETMHEARSYVDSANTTEFAFTIKKIPAVADHRTHH